MRSLRPIHVAVAALLLCVLPGCRVTDWELWRPADARDSAFAVERILGVPYYDGPDADKLRHRADLFLPKGVQDYPVVILVHGGAWVLGDNRCCGLYSSVGEYLASQGIGVVMPNYRLSPGVKHPEHIKDVARAFAWTKKHIGEHGGRVDQLFLVGHSAGGHLTALLTMDERHLKAEGCRTADIRGVIGISGVYHVPERDVEVFLGGGGPRSMRLDQMVPLRGQNVTDADRSARQGLPFSMNHLAHVVFGDDPETRRDASPMRYVRPGLPPFLLLNPQNELPMLAGMSQDLERMLRLHGCRADRAVIERCNHNSVLFNAIRSSDPTAQAIVGFVHEHAH
jgi:acetyl esterase/lipase